MIKQQPHVGHSDLAPSSKDWAPGSSGRDEDYTPEKDLWAQTHPEDGNSSRRESQTPSRDLSKGGSASRVDDVQRPDPEDEEERLDEALQESFPASDPPAPAHPDVTGWDVDEKAKNKKASTRSPDVPEAEGQSG